MFVCEYIYIYIYIILYITAIYVRVSCMIHLYQCNVGYIYVDVMYIIYT